MDKSEAIEKAKVLKALIELNKVSKIMSSFMPVFKDKTIPVGNTSYLHGFFNIGGTVSGRLSSSHPNIQQLPSNSAYAKPIKNCFRPPEGWLMVGIDYTSLEARVDALLTKDPQKLKVYTDGFDSHSLAARYYWPDKMSDIDPNSVSSVNSIKDKYSKLRQASKAVSFASLYGGTYHTLMKNCGFSEEEAKSIEANYHELYKESDVWKANRLNQASKDGYAECAFGLRVRTPLLKQVVWGSNNMPREAMAESRTVGNAMGQSYGLLNNRACNAFLEAVWASEYATSILPIAQIHDSSYWLIKDDAEVLKFLNDKLVKEYNWNDLPEIKHDQVGLGGEVEIYSPSWANPVAIKNNASMEEIEDVLWAINLCRETRNGLLQ